MSARFATALPGVTARKSGVNPKLGQAQVYELSERISFLDDKGHKRWTTLVWLSTSSAIGEVETYAFPCTKVGKVRSWSELQGSERGTASHTKVLGNMGFVLAGGSCC
jgi:hypothetical protein